jgi:predicted lipoprotein with Yx(FWY)xxD motif
VGGIGASVAALGLGLALAMTSGPAPAAARQPAEIGARVVVRTTTVHKYGKILVTKKGLALYYNKGDKSSHWACTFACLTTWPPLTVPKGETVAQLGTGIKGLGTVPGLTGLQVTWDGWALYTFSQDTTGTVKGQGIGGAWYVAQLSRPPAPTTRGAHASTSVTTTTAAGWG